MVRVTVAMRQVDSIVLTLIFIVSSMPNAFSHLQRHWRSAAATDLSTVRESSSDATSDDVNADAVHDGRDAITQQQVALHIAVLLPDMKKQQVANWSFGIQKVRPAIELALESIEQRFQRRREESFSITVHYEDSYCNIAAAINEAFGLYLQQPIDVIFGPCCDYAAAPVVRQARYWNIPVITSGAMGSVFRESKHREMYTSLTRVGSSFNKMAHFVVTLLDYYGWKKVKMLYDRDGKNDVVDEMCHMAIEGIHLMLLGQKNITQRHYKFTHEDAVNDTLLIPEIANEFAVIVLCANADSIREIMITAAKNNFDNGDYVFFNIDLFSSKLQLEQPWKRDNDTAERNALARRGFQALKTITLRKPDSKEYKNFSDEVKRRAGPEVYGEEEVNSFVGAFHDAVVLYALAVNETLADKMDPHNGTDITRRMWNRSFKGITGNVTIDKNGDRNVDYSLLDMDPATGRFEVVANYFGSRQIYEPVPGKKIHWAGNRTAPPVDTPACGFDNEKCQPFPVYAIILIGVGILMLSSLTVAFLIYRRWKLLRELAKIVIRWKDIHPINCGGSGSEFERDSRQVLNHRPSLLTLNLDGVGADYNIGSAEERQWFTKAGSYTTRIVAIKETAQPVHWSHKLALECKKLKDLQHDHINRFIGICIDRSCIITEYCPRGSLMDVLENDNLRLDDMFKLSLIQDIVNGMIFLHSSEVRSHGSLKSSNCLVDSRFALKITDFGLPSLRSTNGYVKNFSEREVQDYCEYFAKLWTAPELLKKDKFPVQGTPKGDIYSFAIICHEIVMRKGPFWRSNADMDPEEIYWLVRRGNVDGRGRPTLLDDDSKKDSPLNKLNSLIRRCWKEEPEERPEFQVIKSQLKQIYKDSPNSGNLLDNLLNRMQQYATNLESLVEARTASYLQEKKRAEDLLHQMLPRSVAEELMETKKVTPVRFDEVTVYFSDIVGFTELANEKENEPIEIVNLLNDLYCLFDRIIGQFDVYKVETIGDAYMVVSGMPELNENRHAREICRMALALRRAVDTFVIRHKPEEKLKLRIGIHSGSVCACVVGEKMPRYCLVGDTVNTASRMESNGKPLQIHVSPKTKKILDTFGTFLLRKRRTLIHPKGLKAPMQTWWLLGETVNTDVGVSTPTGSLSPLTVENSDSDVSLH